MKYFSIEVGLETKVGNENAQDQTLSRRMTPKTLVYAGKGESSSGLGGLPFTRLIPPTGGSNPPTGNNGGPPTPPVPTPPDQAGF